MGIATDPARELALKIEVLQDLEEPVRELMENHERKRELWFPADILGPLPESCPDEFTRSLRSQASGIPALLVFQGGQVVERLLGAQPAPALRQALARHVAGS